MFREGGGEATERPMEEAGSVLDGNDGKRDKKLNSLRAPPCFPRDPKGFSYSRRHVSGYA